MIDVNFAQKEDGQFYMTNSHNSLLIVGKGDSEYQNIKIVYPKNTEEVEETFGIDSQLTMAYKEAKQIGAEEVYLCNCYRFSDYINALDLIAQNDFAYIAPLFDFSTTFINPLDNKETYLVELYSDTLNECFSNIFFTDKHASLFEDIDHYLRTMKGINYNFKDEAFNRLINGENMCFVLNNLSNYKYGNVVLAALIAQSNLRDYPQKNLGEVVFDINNNDLFDHELIYFSYDDLANTTVDNLQNYYIKPAPEKMLLNSIIKNLINASLDYDQFTGKLISSYTKIQIENYTKEVLQKFTGKIIEKFKLIEVQYEKVAPGEIGINIYISIKPYNSIEEIDMTVEV